MSGVPAPLRRQTPSSLIIILETRLNFNARNQIFSWTIVVFSLLIVYNGRKPSENLFSVTLAGDTGYVVLSELSKKRGGKE